MAEYKSFSIFNGGARSMADLLERRLGNMEVIRVDPRNIISGNMMRGDMIPRGFEIEELSSESLEYSGFGLNKILTCGLVIVIVIFVIHFIMRMMRRNCDEKKKQQ